MQVASPECFTDTTRAPIGAETALIRRPLEGRWFGQYRLIERIGCGCQAQVWKALRIDPVVEIVALKILAPSLALDDRKRAQFHQEAEVGARLDSPWILPTFEFGAFKGIYYMTMPLVDGGTLADTLGSAGRTELPNAPGDWNWWCMLSPASFTQAMVRVVARIARALHTAHRNGVAHRDVKPANILVDRHREDRVFLCDFGLGQDLRDSREPASRDCTGSPLYMAPEKLIGFAVDEIRCDVYSLGVTLFEALARIHPFSIPEELPRSDWAAYLGFSKPRELLSTNPDLPAALDRIVRTAMHRDPNRRYPTAAALADELERFSAGTLGR